MLERPEVANGARVSCSEIVLPTGAKRCPGQRGRGGRAAVPPAPPSCSRAARRLPSRREKLLAALGLLLGVGASALICSERSFSRLSAFLRVCLHSEWTGFQCFEQPAPDAVICALVALQGHRWSLYLKDLREPVFLTAQIQR